MEQRKGLIRRSLAPLAAVGLIAAGIAVHLADAKPPRERGGQIQLPTTLEDFFQPGTQPDPTGMDLAPVISAANCGFCHADYLPQGENHEPFNAWVASTMGQSARDPVWKAALAIANQDANMSGEYCIRCHSPGAWLGGRSTPPDASGFINTGNVNDFEGVTCNYCHRAVDPVYAPENPTEDIDILADLMFPPGAERGNGRHVVDPVDVRRGPFDDVPLNLHSVDILYSPFHQESEMCATCHDLRNPAYSRQPDGTYAANNFDEAHPTQNPHDMMPEQLTYSEWLNSQFATTGVEFTDGRFGGNLPSGIVGSCQDCHMPNIFTGGCFAFESEPFFPRPDMPQHSFAGANTWVLKAVRALYPDSETGLTDTTVDSAVARTMDMLRAASDTEAVQLGDQLKVRVINYSGHKLPTGYPEGRRMWVNVKYYDAADQLIDERGAYDFVAAELDDSDTKVYRAEHGIDQAVADATNLTPGKTFHLVLNNVRVFDNRIPPIGWTNAAYEAFDGDPIGQTYADGQHWDDTEYSIPSQAVRAVVTLYHQSMTKEYIEFLRDTNTTNNDGQVVYDLWDDPAVGNRVPPVDMDVVEVDLSMGPLGELTGDGMINSNDLFALLGAWGECPGPSLCPEDLNCDGLINAADLFILLGNWG